MVHIIHNFILYSANYGIDLGACVEKVKRKDIESYDCYLCYNHDRSILQVSQVVQCIKSCLIVIVIFYNESLWCDLSSVWRSLPAEEWCHK